jgi:hypothetical protein
MPPYYPDIVLCDFVFPKLKWKLKGGDLMMFWRLAKCIAGI